MTSPTNEQTEGRLFGHPVTEEMRKLRDRIRGLGGQQALAQGTSISYQRLSRILNGWITPNAEEQRLILQYANAAGPYEAKAPEKIFVSCPADNPDPAPASLPKLTRRSRSNYENFEPEVVRRPGYHTSEQGTKPVLRGFVKTVGQDTQIFVHCPLCDKFHTHSWSSGSVVPESRTPHCTEPTGFKDYYWIAPFSTQKIKSLGAQ